MLQEKRGLFFDQDFIDKVMQSSDIVELIGQYTRLQNKGRSFMGTCPFPSHNEKTPSFSVSDDKQLYHCFGCGKSGNIFTFLKEYNGLSFPEAVEYLAKRAGLPLPERSVSAKQNKNSNQIDLKKLNEICRDQYRKALSDLPESHPAKVYLANRGLTADLIELFHIGFAPDSWDFISAELKKKNYSFKQLSELGLFKSKDGQSYYDVFRNRIIFPILSPTGDVLGFGGRVLDDSKPKYLNSPETSVFKKSKTFYGLYETAKEIRAQDYAIVVEGYTDLIALYKFGFKNVVATLGTALTEEHAHLIKRYTKNVIVLFDGDSAGINASEKAMRHLLKEGLLVKGIYLPENDDPDSFLQKHGADGLNEQIQRAKDLYILYLDRTIKKYGTAQVSDKMNIAGEVAPVLGEVGLGSLRELYVQETAFRLDVEESWLLKVVAEHNQRQSALQARYGSHDAARSRADGLMPNEKNADKEAESDVFAAQIETIKLKNVSVLERDLINIMLMDENCLQLALSQVTPQMLQGLEVLPIFEKISSLYGQKPTDFGNLTAVLMSFVEPKSFLAWHLRKPLSELTSEQRTRMVNDCIAKLKTTRERAKMQQTLKSIGSNPSPEELEQIVNMKKRQWDLKGPK